MGHLETALRVGLSGHPALRNPERFNRGPASHCEDSLHTLVSPVRDHFPRPWHSPHEVMKLPFDRRKIVEDVCVIELDIIENRGAGTVVDELRALVEKSGVVLVGLD